MNRKFEDLILQRDRAWYWYLMSKDPLYSKLDPSSIPSLISRAEECGISVASKLVQRYGTNDIFEIYKLLGISVVESEDTGSFGFYFLSLYEPDSLVRVYTNRVEEVKEIIRTESENSALFPEKVETHLLAHELYHFRENQSPELFTENHRFTLWKIGPFAYKSRLNALSEIGATAFTKAFCNINYNPCIINYALLLCIAPQSADRLYREVMSKSLALENPN